MDADASNTPLTGSVNPLTGEAEASLLEMRPCLASFARLRWDEVRQKQLLLWPEGVLVLNDSAGAILPLCDNQHRISEIIAELSSRYHKDVKKDVLAFLNRLVLKRLVVFNE